MASLRSATPRKKCRSKSASAPQGGALASAVVVPDRTRTASVRAWPEPTQTPSSAVWHRVHPASCGTAARTVVVLETRRVQSRLVDLPSRVSVTFSEFATRESTVGMQVAPSLPAGRASVARPALPVDSLASGDHMVWFTSTGAERSRCGCGVDAVAVRVWSRCGRGAGAVRHHDSRRERETERSEGTSERFLIDIFSLGARSARTQGAKKVGASVRRSVAFIRSVVLTTW